MLTGNPVSARHPVVTWHHGTVEGDVGDVHRMEWMQRVKRMCGIGLVSVVIVVHRVVIMR